MNIEVHDGLINQELLQNLEAYLAESKFKYGWKSESGLPFSHWNHEIIHVGKRNIIPINFNNKPVIQSLWDVIKEELPENAYPIRCYANLHTFGIEGYPHKDSIRPNETTVVLYMVKEWKREWGGETAFYDNQEITRSVMPKENRIVMFPGNVYHCARALSRICPVSRTTLMIKARHPFDDANLIKLETFLYAIGAEKKPHKYGKLLEHLIRVYELLKSKRAPLNVCLAGGLHSLYGTFSYTDITLKDRSVIKEHFNEEIEELVYNFSQLKNYNGDNLPEPMKLIIAANLADQESLKKGSSLKEFWQNYGIVR